MEKLSYRQVWCDFYKINKWSEKYLYYKISFHSKHDIFSGLLGIKITHCVQKHAALNTILLVYQLSNYQLQILIQYINEEIYTFSGRGIFKSQKERINILCITLEIKANSQNLKIWIHLLLRFAENSLMADAVQEETPKISKVSSQVLLL